MVEILRDKSLATRFQIMVEIADGGPDIQQKKIAARLGVTPQAVSEHIRRLVDDGLVISTSRSSYRVSTHGVNWMLEVLRGLQDYASFVQQAVTNITVCAAIAESNITHGQRVGLKMKDGLLFATTQTDVEARGTAVSSAKQGEDVGITEIEGLIALTRGKVTILQVPAIQKGGVRRVNLKCLQAHIDKSQRVAALGIEALVALRKAGIEPHYLYGVTEAIVEAAHCGLSSTIACTSDNISNLIRRLEEENLDYQIHDLARKSV
ncbi:MAG: winged helix-turn-helix transcriptional regulator [Chloroflexi bacterium]|nr:winged helix-turn-helix transcriptional regulator [Chloroflexota bacterium]